MRGGFFIRKKATTFSSSRHPHNNTQDTPHEEPRIHVVHALCPRHDRQLGTTREMHAHAVFAAQASFISIARKGAAANTNNNDNNSHHPHAVVNFRNNGVSKRASSSSSSSSLGGVATRAASGREAGSSASSSSAQQREQKPGYSQNAAIKLLGDMDENPWSVNTYHSKRATHKVNELGDIIGEDDAPENILEQPGWDDAGKLRFCVSTVAAELDLREEEVGEKLRQLFTLAPGIERRVGEVKVADIVRMVASLPDVTAAFLKLRTILPAADLVWRGGRRRQAFYSLLRGGG